MSSETITIQIAEDQAITRFGLKCTLEALPGLQVIAESEDGIQSILHALAYKPDIILMDIGLPKVDGIKASRQIKSALSGTKIIMFTGSDKDEDIYEALGAGADGYCLKNVAREHLYSAIKAVRKGVTWLDPGVADRVLRSRQAKKDAAMDGDEESSQLNVTLDDNQMLILHMLSQGASLDEVARKFNLTTEGVALRVNATIALLNANAAVHGAATRMIEAAPWPTTLADRYTIESVLGRGGMGIVYKGRHKLMDRPVAIKMLHPSAAEDEVVSKRFQVEAKSLSTLSHPNLVAVFDYGVTTPMEPYMVMDYHQGQGLDQILQDDGTIETNRALEIFCQICDALAEVHKHNLVHRDIKPSNIVVSKDGVAKLVDFGLAKKVGDNSTNLTMAGEVVGTPKYMSPEQCLARELDGSSDIYSLGCVMYEVFTGQPPFDADSFYEMVRQHVDDPPSRLPLQASPNVSPRLQAIILKAMAKEPSKRYANPSQLKHDLMSAISRKSVAV